MSSEEERARRSVERMFPEVARFLGQTHGELPVYGPTDPHTDEDHTPEVIVRVDYALSRAQVATALGISFAEIAGDRTPEELTVVETRYEVEGYLACQGLFDLSDQMERDAQRTFPPEQQRVLQLLAEAVERAYPPRREPEQLAVQDPRYGEGTVTLTTTDRGEVTIPEPTWCKGHQGELVGRLSEVSHDGPEILAVVETADAGEVPLMRANLTHAPFLEIQPEPHPVVYVEALEAASFDAEGLRQVAATGRAYLGQLEALAVQLDALAEEGQL